MLLKIPPYNQCLLSYDNMVTIIYIIKFIYFYLVEIYRPFFIILFYIMTESFLNGFLKRSLSKSTATTGGPYGPTIPSSDCVYNTTAQQSFPISKYAGYGVNAWEVLYSIWVANQSTNGAKFTYNQALNHEPTTSPCIGPANIFIIRHGEKDPSGTVNFNINNNGIYRASQLVEYVNKLCTAGTPISYIITCNPCPYTASDPSMRPQQTAMMASFLLNIPLFIYGGSQDYSDIVTPLFTPGFFDGLNVLICWEHTSIQQLCLNIINKAATLSTTRFPLLLPTNSYPEWYGDAYFKEIGDSDNRLCPGGNYLAPIGVSNYYIITPTSPGLPNQTPTGPSPTYLPPCIGPNSQYYPYWNNDDFDAVYLFNSDSSYNFTFNIGTTPIFTCYPNCELHIGLYQPLNTECTTSNKYTNEDSCEDPPASWTV
jgi:hypothetical protein